MKKFLILIASFLGLGVLIALAVAAWAFSPHIIFDESSGAMADDAAFILKRAKSADSVEYQKVKLNIFHRLRDATAEIIEQHYEPLLNHTLNVLKDTGGGFVLRFEKGGSTKAYLRRINNKQALTIDSPSKGFCERILFNLNEYETYKIELAVSGSTLAIPPEGGVKYNLYLNEMARNLKSNDIERMCQQKPLIIDFYFHGK